MSRAVSVVKESPTHLRRFYAPDLIAGGHLVLGGEEAHHARHVLRLREGDEITLFDGRGTECPGRIVSFSAREAEVEVGAAIAVDREAAAAVTLAVGMPKGKRADLLVEKATELGVAAIVPLVCANIVMDPRVRAESHQERWRRAAVEACKQSGRNRVPDVGAPATLSQLLACPEAANAPSNEFEGGGPQVPGASASAHRLICTPRAWALPIAAYAGAQGAFLVLVGPEGGFTDAEEALALNSGCVAVTLGPRRLRVETAALAAAAVLCLSGRPL